MRLLARLVISVGLLSLILKTAGTGDVLSSLARCSPGPMLLAFSCTMLGVFICAVRWQFLLNPGGHRLSLWLLTRLYFVGQFFNFFLPSTVGGDIARAHFASKSLSHAREAYVSVIIERFLGLLSLGIVATGSALLLMSKGGGRVLPGMAGFGLTLVLSALLVVKTNAPERLCAMLSRWRTRKLAETLVSAVSCARSYANRPGAVASAFALSFVYQILGNIIPIYLVASSVGIHVGLAHFLLVVPIIAVVSMVPITINGMGVREGAFVMTLGWFGVTASAATAASLLWFALVAVTSAIGGLVYLIGPLQRKQPSPIREVHPETEQTPSVSWQGKIPSDLVPSGLSTKLSGKGRSS